MRMELAARLKFFREKAGLTIYEAGEKIGKSGKTVSAWECGRGQPDADMLLKLCDVYGINSISELYGEEHKENRGFSDHEIAVISAYRAHPEMQAAVDKLLNVDSEAETVGEDMIETVNRLSEKSTVQK